MCESGKNKNLDPAYCFFPDCCLPACAPSTECRVLSAHIAAPSQFRRDVNTSQAASWLSLHKSSLVSSQHESCAFATA